MFDYSMRLEKKDCAVCEDNFSSYRGVSALGQHARMIDPFIICPCCGLWVEEYDDPQYRARCREYKTSLLEKRTGYRRYATVTFSNSGPPDKI